MAGGQTVCERGGKSLLEHQRPFENISPGRRSGMQERQTDERDDPRSCPQHSPLGLPAWFTTVSIPQSIGNQMSAVHQLERSAKWGSEGVERGGEAALDVPNHSNGCWWQAWSLLRRQRFSVVSLRCLTCLWWQLTTEMLTLHSAEVMRSTWRCTQLRVY